MQVPCRGAPAALRALLLLAFAGRCAAAPGACRASVAAEGISLLQRRHESKLRRQLHVAFAAIAPYGVLKSAVWRDSLAVLARSAQRASSQSAHRVELLALMPDSLPRQEEEGRAARALGLEPRFVPVPVPLEQVADLWVREELSKVLGELEQLKYYGANFTEYDRVVVLDGDTIFLGPIDELLEDTSGAQLQGIYDHELDIEGSAFPPLNSGFLVYTPDGADFDGLAALVRRGDFRPGTGWEGSGTGWTYGTGSQGVLSFWYNQVHPGVKGYDATPPVKGKDLPGANWTVQPAGSRFRPLDRSVYNVIETDLLQEALAANLTDASRVRHFHFTGKCSKPWQCSAYRSDFCEEMLQRWSALRAELARERGGQQGRCSAGGKYQRLPAR